MEKIRVAAKFLLGFPLTIVALYFILSFIYKNWQDVEERFSNFNLPGALVGLAFLFLFFLARSIVWNKLLASAGFKLRFIDSTYLLSISEIKRYIPGSILGLISRVKNFKSYNVPTDQIINSIFYESIIFLLTSIIVSIPGVLFVLKSESPLGRYQQAPIALLLIIVAIFSIVFLSSKQFSNKVRQAISHLFASRETFLYMCLGWVSFGVGSYILAASFYPIPPERIAEVSSLFVLSWVAGYIVLVAPLGLGVREAVAAYGLSLLIPSPLAAALAIIARIGFTISEVLFLAVAFIFHRFLRIKTKIDYYAVAVFSMIGAYASYFTYYSFEKYANFFTGRFDLGNMDQTVWNTLNGRFFAFTNPDGTETISRLAFHADFILILLSPFYIIWNDPRMLLLIQSVVLGLGAYFVYLISNNVVRKKNISLILALSFLLNPFVQKQNLFDFHAVTLATTFLLAAFYFTLVKKYAYFLLFLLLAVLTKENLYIVSFIFGIYLFMHKRKVFWLSISVISIAMLYLLFNVLIPGARGTEHFAVEFFSDYGDSPAGIAKNIILNPASTLTALTSGEDLDYLYKLFLPVGGIAVAFPIPLVFAASDLVINLLSKNVNFRDITFHYAATIIPFIYIATIYGSKIILNRFKRAAWILSLYLLFFALAASYKYGVLPGSEKPSLEIYNSSLANRAEIDSFLSRIPPSLSVAATNNLGSHLAHREKLYTIPVGVYEADVVVLLLNDVYAQPSLAAQREVASSLASNPSYLKIYESGDFVAFAKR